MKWFLGKAREIIGLGVYKILDWINYFSVAPYKGYFIKNVTYFLHNWHIVFSYLPLIIKVSNQGGAHMHKKLLTTLIVLTVMCLGTANVFAMEDTATNSERADKAEKRQARIEEIAAKRGTTVSEVEAQFEAYKVEADALGITVKEYRVQLREEKLAEKLQNVVFR